MKIVILGASGQTGQCLVDQALEAGHTVTAVVRTPSKITKQHDNLKVVKGDVFSADELTEAFKDQEAVVSALGFSSAENPQTGFTESMKMVVTAMRATNVSRLIVMTSFYTDLVSARGRGVRLNDFLIPAIKSVLVNMKEMEDWLEAEVGDVNWTVVRPGGLSTAPRLDQTPLEEEGGQFVSDSAAAMMIPRANVAAFMLSQLSDEKYIRKVVAIAVK